MVQKPRMQHRQKKKNKGVIIGGSTAVVLAIVGGIFYTAMTNDEAAPDTTTPNSITMNNEETNVSQGNDSQQQTAPDVQLSEETTAADNEPSSEANETAQQEPKQQTEATNEQQNEAAAQAPAKEIDATKYIDGQQPATAPTYINGILLANKQYPLPKSYNPGVDPTAQQAMDQLIAAAKTAGFSITAFSGFRSYEYQNTLYTNYVARDGQAEADRYSARPGYSEHQTGLAFDVGEVGKEDLWLTAEFGETPAGKWLVDHAHEHGFILRYPEGKEHLTGFMYESWHFRYVGKEAAAKIKAQNVTLEEYLGVYDEVTSNTTSSISQPQAQQQVSEQQEQQEEKPQVGAKTNDNQQ